MQQLRDYNEGHGLIFIVLLHNMLVVGVQILSIEQADIIELLMDSGSNLKPRLDGILHSSVSNLRGDYHNPLPAKLVHMQKINHRRLVICWKTRWLLFGNYRVWWDSLCQRVSIAALAGKAVTHKISCR